MGLEVSGCGSAIAPVNWTSVPSLTCSSLAPFTLALVLGNRAEDAFRLAMIGAGGDLRVFWSNGLVGSITTLAFVLLFWPLLGRLFERASRLWRPANEGGARAT